MKADFSSVAGKLVSYDEFKARYNDLVKQEMTFGEKLARNLLNRPASLLVGFEHGLRVVFSKAAAASEPATYTDARGKSYINVNGMVETTELLEKRHPILANLGPQSMNDKIEALTLQAVKECRDYSDRKIFFTPGPF